MTQVTVTLRQAVTAADIYRDVRCKGARHGSDTYIFENEDDAYDFVENLKNGGVTEVTVTVERIRPSHVSLLEVTRFV